MQHTHITVHALHSPQGDDGLDTDPPHSCASQMLFHIGNMTTVDTAVSASPVTETVPTEQMTSRRAISVAAGGVTCTHLTKVAGDSRDACTSNQLVLPGSGGDGWARPSGAGYSDAHRFSRPSAPGGCAERRSGHAIPVVTVRTRHETLD